MEQQNELWVNTKLNALGAPGEWTPDTASGLARLRRRQANHRRRRVVLAGACVAAAASMTLPGTRAYAERCVVACVEESRAVLGRLGSERYDEKSARPMAPAFDLTDQHGKPLRLADFQGKVVVLNYWATWCHPCKAEIPWFNEFQTAYEGQGCSVIGISVDEDGWKAVRPFVDQLKITYPVGVGTSHVEALPTTLIIDRRGRVAVTHTGLVSREQYAKDIETVLAER